MRQEAPQKNSSVHSTPQNNSSAFTAKLKTLRPFNRARFAVLSALIAMMAMVSYTVSSASSTSGFLRSPEPNATATAKSGNAGSIAPAAKKQIQTSAKSSEEARHSTAEMNIERKGHTATSLPNGKILIVGGENQNGQVAEAEIYDSASRSFSLSARLHVARAEHTATRLGDGRTLIVGGRNQEGSLKSTEIFDPSTNSFSQGPSLKRARAGHTATVLNDGRILIAGGNAEGSAEIYEPATGRFNLVAAQMNAPRAAHAAVLLKSGKVLIAGGQAEGGNAIQAGEIFDPQTMQFSVTRNMMRGARTRPTLNVLPDGKVQVIGGDDERSMEMFNAEGSYFTAYAHLVPDADSQVGITEILRAGSGLGLIHNSGGASGFSAQSAISEMRTDSLRARGTLGDLLDRSGYTATQIPESGQTMIAGGQNSSGQTMRTMTLLDGTSATVTTDKTDYAPGEIVIITGTNWQPNSTVTLVLHREPNTAPDTTLTATVGDDGTFTNSSYTVQDLDLNVTFTLTATGIDAAGQEATAQTTFTDAAQNLGYSPSSQSLTITAGSTDSFSQTVTAPTGNGSFTASLQVAGTGVNPIPVAWISTSPTTLSFVTTSSAGDTKSWTVTVLPPSGATTGTYTANIKANPNITGLGPGPGTALTVIVNSPCTESTAPTGASASVNPICLGGNTTLSVTGGSLGTGASWKWYAGTCGGAFVGTGAAITVNPNTTATYYVRAEGDCNTTACASVTVTVNTPPVITTVTGPSGPVAKGTSTGVTVNFTGPVGLAHTVTISWDDGGPSSTVNLAPGVFTTGLVSHLYSSAGVYAVGVTVNNSCGSASIIFEFIVIYDPSGGFVTGGGWINSPAGAYLADPYLTGRANFGFVSKYKRGATIPEGETEFQFQVASFNFHSIVYEWLVISGAKAQYKGSGTINGTGDYGFLLTATDGQINGGGGVDKFRIKIWDKITGDVVYDNRRGSPDDIDTADPQAIAGGSIVIHK